MRVAFPTHRAAWAVALFLGCTDRPSFEETALSWVGDDLPSFDGDGFVPTLADGSAARVRLPRRADAPFTLSDDTGFILRAHLVGTRPVPASVEGDVVVYQGALGAGVDHVHRPSARGTEDFIVLREPPGRAEIEYDVDVSSAAGLRLIGTTLELLDEQGAPRARVVAPVIVEQRADGSEGLAHPLRLDVSDCAVDRDPRPPWGRPTVDPGSATCRLLLRWDADAVRYPAVVDPAWTLVTSDMAESRTYFGIAQLTDGRVLAVGGFTNSCELYDPATKTWAAAAPTQDNHSIAPVLTLDDGTVMVVGGGNGTGDTVEIYTLGSGTWSYASSTNVPRWDGTGTVLASGKVLVTGGDDAYFSYTGISAAEIWDPATDTWTSTPSMARTRTLHRAVLLPDGRVLLSGDWDVANAKSAEIYDPATNTFTEVAPMNDERSSHALTLLDDGTVLAAVGWDWLSAEIYDPVVDTWTMTVGGPIIQNADGFAIRMSSGSVLLGGGYDPYTTSAKSQLYDVQTGRFYLTTKMIARRETPFAAQLPTGAVLVVGGYQPPNSELFTTDAVGSTCFYGAACTSGFCVEGICCDDACDDPCRACTAAKKGSGMDGTCGPVPADTDPKNACPTESPATCGTTGTCDGAGSCVVYGTETLCAPPSCSDGEATTPLCDGAGTCVSKMAACAPFGCSGAGCALTCNGDAGCDDSAWCLVESGTCVFDLMDGAPCDRGGRCLSGQCIGGLCSTLSSCVDDHTYVDPGGTPVDCAPFACGPSGCFDACNSLLECASPNVCRAGGTCGTPTTNGGSLSGCAIATAGLDDPRGWLMLALGLVGCTMHRRRSRRAWGSP